MTTWWCECALLPGGVAAGVTVTESDGRFTLIAADTVAPPGSTRLGGLTLPGFANAHSHAFHRALRSRVQADGGTFWSWRAVMYEAATRLDPDNYHQLARAVFAEMASAGITAVGEFHYVHHAPDGSAYRDPNEMGLAIAQAAAEVGIRLTLLDTLYLHAGLADDGARPPLGAQLRFTDGTVENWVSRVDRLQETSTRRVGAAIHSVRAVDPDSMRSVVEWATSRQAPLHAHVSEQRSENDDCIRCYGCTPTELLAAAGALGPNFTAVHATHLAVNDISLLGSGGSSVCMCPTTERDLGDGIGPTAELAEAGVTMSLGSDSHAVIDQMAEARAVELDERLRSERRGVHVAGELLRMATEFGHGDLGWSDAGRIAEGYRADLVTISLDSVRTAGAPRALALEAAVFASTASDITSVVADGRQIASNGTHDHIDVAHELETAIVELLA